MHKTDYLIEDRCDVQPSQNQGQDDAEVVEAAKNVGPGAAALFLDACSQPG